MTTREFQEELMNKIEQEKNFLESQLTAWKKEKGSERDKQNLNFYNSTDLYIYSYEEKIRMVEKISLFIIKEMLRMELKNKFWLSEEEMVEDLEKKYGYDVIDVDYDYIELMPQDGWEDETITFKLIRAGKTITIK